jgi:hypothetical protein
LPQPSRHAVRARSDAAPASPVLWDQVPYVTVRSVTVSTCRSTEPIAATRRGILKSDVETTAMTT